MAKKAKTASKSELPNLVSAMTKLVERLETLERKTDQLTGRIASLPNEIRRAIQDLPRSQSSQQQPAVRPEPFSQQNQGPRERILHQAVCADCQKRCEVPFRPSGDRPVYCPECWAIRKAGHVPKDLTSHVVVPSHLKVTGTVSSAESKAAAPPFKGKQAKRASSGKKTAPKSSPKKKKKK